MQKGDIEWLKINNLLILTKDTSNMNMNQNKSPWKYCETS